MIDVHDGVVSPGSSSAPNVIQGSPAPGLALDFIAADLRPLAVPIVDLVPAPDNARRHSLARDIPALMESFRRFGQCKAIVAKRRYRGLANVVLCGNGALLAAQRLGWSHLAVSWFEGGDDEARAFAVVDNAQAALSEWNLDVLARDVADIDLSTWFAPGELADLLGADAPVPQFAPVCDETQGRLDFIQKPTITCPACGHTFAEGL